ncbi:MAG: hypothetical protein SFY80_12770 [Verrucomicrobiota bacterium]|nr:hypothetical protein [Verrucomicrobiota bacterium]
MKSQTNSTAHLRVLSGLLLGLAALAGTINAFAAAPLAGTAIGNQASATYTDDSGATRTATSNTVITIVQQVASFDLIDPRTRSVAPGGTVYFPHTLINLGNGTDSFDLSAALTTGSLTNIFIYADADNNGIPDNFVNIATTGNVAAGASFNFVVAATMPGNVVAPHTSTVTVTATSDFSQTGAGAPVQTDTNLDTAVVTADAVLVVTKSISVGSGPPGTTPVTYTLTYTNSGNNTATNFTITDAIPVGMTYIANSARWSVTGAGTVLSDSAVVATQGTAPNTIDYSITGSTITALIGQVIAGQSGSLTFQVGVNLGIAPQTLINTANHTYDPDGPGVTPPTSPTPTNPVPFVVTQVAIVAADDPLSGAVPNADDLVEITTAIQGATVTFVNRVVNLGNGPDTFDMTFVGNTFPAGTTFQFFKSDGFTPLVDTNSNSIPDTGVLQPGGPAALNSTYLVVVKAFLPTNATTGDNGGAGFTVTKRATSGFNPSVSDTVVDRLGEITGKTVDLTNTTARTDSTPAGTAAAGNAATTGFGFESGDSLAAATVTNNTNPGTTTTFVLYVNNTSATADTYQLAADADGNFGTLNMHTNWAVVFRNDVGGSPGAIITGTGTLNAGTNMKVYAEVTVPPFTTPGIRDIYFRALSPTSNAYDIKRDAVSVNTVRDIGLVSNNAGQVFPGGSVVYAHLLTNNGNVMEANGSPSVITFTLAESLAAQGWNSVVFWDKNGNGSLDAADPAVTVLDAALATWDGLAPNETQRFFVKCFAPLQADALTVNITTITATTSGGAINSVAVPPVVFNKDTTTVVKGDLTLLKEQAIDANSNGVLGDAGDGTFTTLNLTAKPGESIVYRITVTNSGNTDANAIVIYDTTPANTTYNDAGADSQASVNSVTTVVAVPTKPADNATGAFQFNVGNLTPGASAIIRFGVTIDGL